MKPVIGVSALTPGSQLINTTTQRSVLQTQQLKTVQVKKQTNKKTKNKQKRGLLIKMHVKKIKLIHSCVCRAINCIAVNEFF